MRVETQKTITNAVDNGELSLQDLEWVSGGQVEDEDKSAEEVERPEEESGPEKRD
ncbi:MULTISPECIES: hypothetical protein [unclassified Tolypothrix]|uniref:hypothetical protein n=1 Tax=unclassified Tolypothrix TaxID=2649714 RepID=UPI0005EAC6F8|nr:MULTISPECIES: hypothetical protein [unclassified Tolypothrix]BAY95567.1 hypothetical protein NIES3275_76440 [Microchaete diplosiphon NIES-3275]EKE98331.1 hypothetical protein FDUTEX481_04360 [Tolypothrix sp. PCC 7601]MBE9084692.1 hypothetical protein [Tolypothrix sp. LEGE 11397]UYD30644.1 hypothetical protein HGR01_37435 [Tolypothrix sp. PCC 7712]UYD38524.1 hypothetical protein HG267_38655 [Tolypothrix sp. PCC 7601]